jgi:hypothetical protein
LVRIIYALFTRQETFNVAKLISAPVSAPPISADEELPKVSELSENLARIVDMTVEDDLVETSSVEMSLASPTLPAIPNVSVQSVVIDNPKVKETNVTSKKRRSSKTANKQEPPTTAEPTTRRRGRPCKQQTEG